MEFTQYNLILTDNCNLRCTYCFDNLYSNRDCNSNTKIMTEDMIPNILHFAEQTASTKLPITFNMFGGEPLANWKFFKSFVEITNSHFKHEHKFITTINGTLLNSKIIDFLAKNKVAMRDEMSSLEEARKHLCYFDGSKCKEIVLTKAKGE